MKIAIVAIGYNRPDSMTRLLGCLDRSEFFGDSVDLTVSIDYSGSDNVQNVANSFFWHHGKKRVIAYKERQGLRKHILQCGELLHEYDALVVFEDDVVPSRGFYAYVKQTVEKYHDDDRIAGISLYKHLWNVNVNLPFEPDVDENDVYFMQYAQSWGQVWMRNQWYEFIEWYNENKDKPFDSDRIPRYVNRWPETSWLKYHIKFCVEKDKYFVYPYKALSTNCSEAGEHNSIKNTKYQVPLLQGIVNNYRLPNFSTSCVIYDAFFERVITNRDLDGLRLDDVEFDLYGNKVNYQRKYIISSKRLPYRRIRSFSLDYRPHEVNVLLEIEGDSIHLYDTQDETVVIEPNKGLNTYEYYHRVSDYRDTEDYRVGNTVLGATRRIRRIKVLISDKLQWIVARVGRSV